MGGHNLKSGPKAERLGTAATKYSKRGASLLSYGLVVGLVAVVALAAITNIGNSVDSLFTDVSDSLQGVGGAGEGAGAGTPETPVASCGDEIGTFVDFNFTGSNQTHTITYSGTYRLEVNGAQGGTATHNDNSLTARGGFGGAAVGERSFVANDQITVVVGGEGVAARVGTGGFNGGGNTRVTNPIGPNAKGNPGTGGGATDMRFGGSSLNDRIIVGGGGGGGSRESNDNDTGTDRLGAHGGGTSGHNASSGNSSVVAFGGTQSSGGDNPSNTAGTPGSFGQGGDGSSNDGGAGGGGWYGGEGGNSNGAGAGGSGYIGILSNASMVSGANSGNGNARITLIACD